LIVAERAPTVHILTKIFIVLVSLLTAALVPLVVVHTHNEDSFKARWEAEAARATSAQSALNSERISRGNAESAALLKQTALESQVSEMQKARDATQARVQQLESELVVAKAREGDVRADLKVLAESHQTNTALTSSLLEETRGLRSKLLDTERRMVELDESLRDVTTQLEVADAARRALQIEIQRLKDENAQALATTLRYETKYGPLDSQDVMISAVDRDFEAVIINVERSKDQTLAEVNVGSRDGVREGWELIIHQNYKLLGKLRIIEVDINRSTGVVILEDPKNRGQVAVGNSVLAKKGL
jgi:hypothetical protein